MASLDECSVCYEVYNKNTRTKITCEHYGACDFNACKKCVRAFLLTTTNDPCCMLCNKAWNEKFLVQHLNASFVRTEYRVHRKELLTQQQISRLPTTMAAAETYKQVKEIEKQIDELANQYRDASRDLSQKAAIRSNASADLNRYMVCYSDISSIDAIGASETPENIAVAYIKLHVMQNVKCLWIGFDEPMRLLKQKYLALTGKELPMSDSDIKTVRKKINELRKIKTETDNVWREAVPVRNIIHDTINKMRHDVIVIKNGGNVVGMATRETRDFIMPCTKSDCRGFLSTHYKCGICDNYTCPKCFELIGFSKTSTDGSSVHACKPENVESADLIRKQTKPCPCCGTRISKIDGCDQMWCTQCHKAFSWNTGKIVTGVIHNPHFYQYQRENGDGIAPRNPGDVPCGGLPQVYEIQRMLQRKLPMNVTEVPLIKSLLEMNRLQHHFVETYINPLRIKVAADQDYEEERVLFIVNEITREEMATRVLRKDGARKKNNAILQVCDLFTTVAIDLFRAITTSEATGIPFMTELNALNNEYENLRQYCMEQFKDVSITYGVCVPCISPEWALTTAKYNSKGTTDAYVEQLETKKKKRDAEREKRHEQEMMAMTLRRLEMINTRRAQPEIQATEP